MDKTDLLPLVERAERQVAGLLEDFPSERWCYQPFPGANHALWTAGHLGVVNRFVTALLEGRQPDAPAAYQGMFGKGSTPSPDPATYLAQTPPEPFQRFASTWGVLIAGMAQHTAFHAGQLAVIRKALGLQPKFA